MRSFRSCLTMYSVVIVKYLLNLLNYRFNFLLLYNKTLKIYRLKITTITFVHNSVGQPFGQMSWWSQLGFLVQLQSPGSPVAGSWMV